MNQLSWQLPPATHRDDPATSHIAESRITKSGKRRKQAEIALDALKRFPNRTCGELARDSGLDYHMLARRLADLAENSLAGAYGRRECETGRGMCQVWCPE